MKDKNRNKEQWQQEQMEDMNPSISIITLNTNVLNAPGQLIKKKSAIGCVNKWTLNTKTHID